MAFQRAAKTNEITPGTIREFQVEGKAIALANVGGKFYAINNTCLHRGGPLGSAAYAVVVDGDFRSQQYGDPAHVSSVLEIEVLRRTQRSTPAKGLVEAADLLDRRTAHRHVGTHAPHSMC